MFVYMMSLVFNWGQSQENTLIKKLHFQATTSSLNLQILVYMYIHYIDIKSISVQSPGGKHRHRPSGHYLLLLPKSQTKQAFHFRTDLRALQSTTKSNYRMNTLIAYLLFGMFMALCLLVFLVPKVGFAHPGKEGRQAVVKT